MTSQVCTLPSKLVESWHPFQIDVGQGDKSVDPGPIEVIQFSEAERMHRSDETRTVPLLPELWYRCRDFELDADRWATNNIRDNLPMQAA